LVSDLLDRFASGDRTALAQILTRVERGERLLVPAAAPRKSLVVGITGSGGAGKSTLVGVLIKLLRRLDKRVAILACDPASPVTGGALLGDRIRVSIDPDDQAVFFRSMSTRGAAGGIAAATENCLPWLAAFGFDVILIETVGAGQDQVAVRPIVDRLILLVTPNAGDEIQWEKAGLIELADVIVINKADLPGAYRVKTQLTHALSLSSNAVPPIVTTIATGGDGVECLWSEIESKS
jgi:LAO/AO transport system ATPase